MNFNFNNNKNNLFPLNNNPFGRNPNITLNNNMNFNINNNFIGGPNANGMMMNNNNIQSNLSPGSSPYVYNKGQNMCIQMTFTLNNEKYILEIEQDNLSSSIIFSCRNFDDITLLFEYYCAKSFNELKMLNKIFQTCDNIYQIFNSIQTLLIKDLIISKPRIELVMNNSIGFYFTCQLYSGELQNTSIIIPKKDRNIMSQFQKLANSYKELNNKMIQIKGVLNEQKFFDKNADSNKVAKISNILFPLPQNYNGNMFI